MIASMTAFARHATTCDFGHITWEVRSLNHRYLDLNFRLPELLRPLEAPLRQCVGEYLQRGKFDCQLIYKPSATTSKLSLNQPLVTALSEAYTTATEYWPESAPLDVMKLLNWPEVLIREETLTAPLEATLLDSFKATMEELVQARQREGKQLQTLIIERLALMADELKKITSRLPELQTLQRNNLIQRFEEAKINLDPERLEQELLILAQKSDIAEETDRFTTHINEMRRIVGKGQVVGRRLDFLTQELNREANTMASKSIDAALTQTAVELKVLIEQVREQIQNIE